MWTQKGWILIALLLDRMDEKVQEEEASLKRLEQQYSKIMKVLDEQLQWLNKELEDLQQDADKRAKVRLQPSSF